MSLPLSNLSSSADASTEQGEAPTLPQSAQQALGLVDELTSRLDELRQWQQQYDEALSAWRQRAEQAEAARDQTAQQLAELEQAQQALANDRRDLEAREQRLAESQQTLAEERNALAQRRAALNDYADDLAARSARLAEREQSLASQQSQVEVDQQALEAQRQALEQERQELERARREAASDDQRATELNERQTALAAREKALADEKASLDAQQAEIEEKRQKIVTRTRQLKQADAVMRRRRDKIRQYLRVLRQREAALKASPPAEAPASETDAAQEPAPAEPAASVNTAADNAGEVFQSLETADTVANTVQADLHQQREELAQIKQILEASERQMIRKWATHRAVGLVAGAVIALVVLAGVSWAAAVRIAPPTWQGTTTLRVSSSADNAAALTPQQIQETVQSAAVLNDAADRLSRAGVGGLANQKALSEALDHHLQVTRTGDRIVFTYASAHKQRVTPLLEAIGQAYMTYANRRGSDQPSARVALDQPARRGAEAHREQTVRMAGFIFGGLTAAAALVALVLRLLLARTPGVFEQTGPELETLDQPSTWSPLRS